MNFRYGYWNAMVRFSYFGSLLQRLVLVHPSTSIVFFTGIKLKTSDLKILMYTFVFWKLTWWPLDLNTCYAMQHARTYSANHLLFHFRKFLPRILYLNSKLRYFSFYSIFASFVFNSSWVDWFIVEISGRDGE